MSDEIESCTCRLNYEDYDSSIGFAPTVDLNGTSIVFYTDFTPAPISWTFPTGRGRFAFIGCCACDSLRWTEVAEDE